MDDALTELVAQKLISMETAYEYAQDQAAVDRKLRLKNNG